MKREKYEGFLKKEECQKQLNDLQQAIIVSLYRSTLRNYYKELCTELKEQLVRDLIQGYSRQL